MGRIAILSMCLLVKDFCLLDVINDMIPPLKVYNPADILFNAPRPVRYLLR